MPKDEASSGSRLRKACLKSGRAESHGQFLLLIKERLSVHFSFRRLLFLKDQLNHLLRLGGRVPSQDFWMLGLKHPEWPTQEQL